MAKKVGDYTKIIEKALKSAGRYNKGLSGQIMALAGAFRTIDLSNDQLDTLECPTVTVVSRYGNEMQAPHPVFKILKDAQDSVTKQMKALGLTAEILAGSDDNDPLVELTRKVQRAGEK